MSGLQQIIRARFLNNRMSVCLILLTIWVTDGSCVCPPGLTQVGETCGCAGQLQLISGKCQCAAGLIQKGIKREKLVPKRIINYHDFRKPATLTTKATPPPTKPAPSCSATQKLISGQCVDAPKPTTRITPPATEQSQTSSKPNTFSTTVEPEELIEYMPNPCPKYFNYQTDGTVIYGLINVPPVKPGMSLQLTIEHFYDNFLLDVVRNNRGSLELFQEETLLKSIICEEDIKFKINFPFQHSLPRLTKILYNGQLICSNPLNGKTITLSYNLETESFVSLIDRISCSDFVQKDSTFTKIASTTIPTVSAITDEVCGDPVNTGLRLIHNGAPSQRTENPWLVAIFLKKPRTSELICGGSLINDRAVLTAAHCFLNENGDILEKEDIILHIGRYNLTKRRENDSIIPTIHKMIIHHDYMRFESYSFDADIAIIILRTPITFTPYIRPICLWNSSSKLNKIVSRKGTVVGWGLNDQKAISDIPYVVDIPIVSTKECKDSHKDFSLIISNRTFCAGYRDGTGPCNGDSGGGLALFQGGRWYLRGIVSGSLVDKETNSCDLYNYIVFTDVAKYKHWINTYL